MKMEITIDEKINLYVKESNRTVELQNVSPKIKNILHGFNSLLDTIKVYKPEGKSGIIELS